MPSARNYGPTVNTGVPPSLPLNAVGTTSPVLPANLVGNVTTEQVVTNPSNVAVPLLVTVPSSAALEQKPFEVIASGYLKTGATLNVTLKLYSGTSLTPGSDTLLGSSGAIAQNSATAPFLIRARLLYDSISGKLTGTIDFLINNTVVAAAAVSNVVTGVNDSNNPVLNFLLSVTFSVANAANLASVADLAVNF